MDYSGICIFLGSLLNRAADDMVDDGIPTRVCFCSTFPLQVKSEIAKNKEIQNLSMAPGGITKEW